MVDRAAADITRRSGLLAAGALAGAAVTTVPALLVAAGASPAGIAAAGAVSLLAGAGALHARRLVTRPVTAEAEVQQLRQDRAALLGAMRTRDEELEVAARMLEARASTMTSVIDAVTEQSIIGTDRDGLVRVWNPGAEKLLGLPRQDVVRRRRITDFHVAEELEAEVDGTGTGTATGLEALVSAAREHGSDVRDWTYVAADGRLRTVSVAATPRTDDRGVHAGWNFVGTDMTEIRATERMKDQFLSLVSHELRTPLASIVGYLELVLDEEESLAPEQRRYLRTVERNAERLQRLVGDLLFTAQVDAGRFTIQPEDVDLAAVVRAAEETARVAATAGQVELSAEVPAESLVVRGDPVRLGQACDNLVSNAVKFTPAGGRVVLRLRAGWLRPEGSVSDVPVANGEPIARLSVSDTGIGIPAGEQGQLFTRFFRASTAQRSAVAGVGLGLAITKAITTAHGGTLDLASAPGRGTTFTLTLPRAGG